jgi:hypothetical protein
MKTSIYWVLALLLTNLNVFGQDMAYQEVEPLFDAIGVKADKAQIKTDLLHKYDQQKIFIEEQRASFDELLESEASFEKLHTFYLDYLNESFTKDEITELSTFFEGDLGQSMLDFGSEMDFIGLGNKWKASQNLKDKLTLDYIEELEVYFNQGVGQKFVQNFQKIYQEGENTFEQWEKVILKQAFDNVKYQWRDEFETDYDLDVDFREGKFERVQEANKIKAILAGMGEKSGIKELQFYIERKDGIQTEYFLNRVFTNKIVWLSNTRYRLYYPDKNGEYQDDSFFVEYNIYAVEGDVVKYTWKSNDAYGQAEMKRID